MRLLRLLFLGLTSLSLLLSCEDNNESKEEALGEVYSPAILIDKLSVDVEETSGLIFFRNAIWTLNDSGGEAAIYCLDSVTGEVIQVVSILDVQNVDFEDITHDDDFIYVGDMGNNFGNRKDFSIFKIAKKDIPEHENAIVKAERIQFRYADQSDFHIKPRQHNFDNEALLSFEDSLYVFTKNWLDGKTRVYAIPKTEGDYTIAVLAEFNVDGLITAAEYNPENATLSLLGYKDFMPFVWIFWDFENNNFFEGKKHRLDLERIHGAQTEGVCFNAKGDLLISSESSYFPQRLYSIANQALKSTGNYEENRTQKDVLALQADYFLEKDQIQLQIKGLDIGHFTVEILNEIWQSEEKFNLESLKGEEENIKLSAEKLISGLYYFRVEQNNKLKVNRVYLNK